MKKINLFVVTALMSFLCVITANPAQAESKINPQTIVDFAVKAECQYNTSYSKPTLTNIKKSVVCKGINDKNLKSSSLVPIDRVIAKQIVNNIEPKYLLYALDKIKRDSPVYKKK
jgi:hypothetical protein